MEPSLSRKITTLNSNYVKEQAEQQQENKKKRRGLYRRLSIMGVFAIVIASILGSIMLSQSKVIQQKMNEKVKLEKQYASLQQQEKFNKEEIVKLNDDEYVAKLARNEYFLSEEGEIIFKLPDKRSSY